MFDQAKKVFHHAKRMRALEQNNVLLLQDKLALIEQQNIAAAAPMPRLRNICLALSLLTCAACSKSSKLASAPAPPAYRGVDAGLLEQCVVRDVELDSTGDIVTSLGIYKAGFEKCAAKIDAIRDHDAKARRGANSH